LSAPAARADSRHFRDSALEVGLHPFPIPLAINFSRHKRPSALRRVPAVRHVCLRDRAKNDADVAVIAPLREQASKFRANAVATELVKAGRRIAEVVAWDRRPESGCPSGRGT